MKRVNLVFCVLTYKVKDDLENFIKSIKSKDWDLKYSIIVVNNYFDDNSLREIELIARENKCDFIDSENNGYGAGNNLAVKYAKENYEYEHLIICNPDTEIVTLNKRILDKYTNSIIAPEILSRDKKYQNPFFGRKIFLSEWLTYRGFKKKKKMYLILSFLIEKSLRNVFNIFVKNNASKQIYACHGSFIIFTRDAVDKLYPIFDENIFLFSEEYDLAHRARESNIPIFYDRNIEILHKEDGSIGSVELDINNIASKSYCYYYEKYNGS